MPKGIDPEKVAILIQAESENFKQKQA
ncbi:unknown protein [Parachlamydia acanthamoebae UV-7]|uniref:Uncharacterized protein n=1 Tax=Parachlamydia acanthamoebae (strain UV7) TaxID=765952 RepID=F8KV57_PARAV|nr:unknown protein [Parachlamydia acanthamoebae UV-7]